MLEKLAKPSDGLEKYYSGEYPETHYFDFNRLIPGEPDPLSYADKNKNLLGKAIATGKDVIKIPSKPWDRILIGFGLAASATVLGAVIIHQHRHSKK